MNLDRLGDISVGLWSRNQVISWPGLQLVPEFRYELATARAFSLNFHLGWMGSRRRMKPHCPREVWADLTKCKATMIVCVAYSLTVFVANFRTHHLYLSAAPMSLLTWPTEPSVRLPSRYVHACAVEDDVEWVMYLGRFWTCSAAKRACVDPIHLEKDTNQLMCSIWKLWKEHQTSFSLDLLITIPVT